MTDRRPGEQASRLPVGAHLVTLEDGQQAVRIDYRPTPVARASWTKRR